MSDASYEIIVEKGDRGWEVRIGPDVLLSGLREPEALIAADRHRRALIDSGEAASCRIKRLPRPTPDL